ncbi:hypothetical protein ACFWAR_00555 [Streptomyces sp. NPDC059917]|uniref:hypothetical protein n=1 Tax=Streptomyces sp. NPDC059917 TaxID=3347002 RepID=UPI00365A8BC3
MKNNRIAMAVTAVVLIAGGSVGCGKAVSDAARDAAALGALAQASAVVSKAGSADVSMTVTAPSTGGKAVAMNGLYSWGAGTGVAMETEMSAADLNMSALVADGTITMRLVDGVYYYGVDPLKEGAAKGKSWLKVEASAFVGEDGAAAMKSGNADPTAGLKLLPHAKDAEELGTEDVRGVETVHYTARIPTDKMVGDAGSVFKGMGATGDVQLDVWVDDKGNPARLKEVVGTTTVEMEFLSFGGSRTVQAPPAADTADLTEGIKKAKSAGAA